MELAIYYTCYKDWATIFRNFIDMNILSPYFDAAWTAFHICPYIYSLYYHSIPFIYFKVIEGSHLFSTSYCVQRPFIFSQALVKIWKLFPCRYLSLDKNIFSIYFMWKCTSLYVISVSVCSWTTQKSTTRHVLCHFTDLQHVCGFGF